jgi:hypothetical protein
VATVTAINVAKELIHLPIIFIRRESLTSDDQQFHQYQQNLKSTITLTYGHKLDHGFQRWEFRFWLWDRHQKHGRFKHLMGIQPFHVDNK